MYVEVEMIGGRRILEGALAYAPQSVWAVDCVRPRWPMQVRERIADDRFSGPDAIPACLGMADIELEATPPESEGFHPDSEAAPPGSETLLPDSDDELFLLGERCAQAYLEADALHYQAMKLLAEFDRREGWKDTGFGSTAEWLAWRIGIKPGAARERLRTALVLERLPETSEAMRVGDVSYTKVRALTRVASPDNEGTLLNFARAGSAANLERVVRGWRTMCRKDEVTAEQFRHRNRRFSAFVDHDGMVVVKGRLDPEVGAVLMRAVEAATDALWRGGTRRADDGREGLRTVRSCRDEETDAVLGVTTPEQKRADAVGLLAERALAAGFGRQEERTGREPMESEGEKSESGGEDSRENHPPISGSRAERYQVMLHVDGSTLEEEGEPGRSELEDGTRVSAETSRRIACDSGLVTIRHGSDGRILGAGRRIRTVSPALRRALEARDRGCRFPGCGLRFTDAHHVKHWADGGETNLRNLVLLCRKHHRAVHEGGARVCIDAEGRVVFFTPRGDPLFGVPPAQSVLPVPSAPPAPPMLPVPSASPAPSEPPAPSASPAPLAPPSTPSLLAPPTSPAFEEAANRKSSGPGQSPGRSRSLMEGGSLEDPAKPVPGTPRWKHDRDIPWAVEARTWEALDPG